MPSPDAPAQLDLFRERLPRKPYCSDNATASMIRTTAHAVRQRYIQHNPPHLICWLIFDLDHRNAFHQWSDAGLPPPAWIALNKDDDAEVDSDGIPYMPGHVAYGIRAPVARSDAARTQPIRYAAAIEHAYRVRLQSDEGYAGLITKNPLHQDWDVWTPANSDGIYELAELAEGVPHLPSAKELQEQNKGKTHGLGRNCRLFDDLRGWAYREIRKYWRPGGVNAWHEAVLRKAERLNNFPEPLPFSEVKATAKSVAKWTWRNLTPQGLEDLIARTHTPELQSARGQQKGKKKRDAHIEQVLQMKAQGYSHRQIGLAVDVRHQTIGNWLKSEGG